jgi:uncharacterized protein (TIGR02145 family)
MDGQTTEGSRGICPVGWHIPALADFQALSSGLGGDSVSGAKLKAGSPSWDGSNTSGFTALPEGYVDYDGGLYAVGQMSFIHTSSPVSPSSSNYINFVGGFDTIYYTNDPNSHARSVRCLKD